MWQKKFEDEYLKPEAHKLSLERNPAQKGDTNNELNDDWLKAAKLILPKTKTVLIVKDGDNEIASTAETELRNKGHSVEVIDGAALEKIIESHAGEYCVYGGIINTSDLLQTAEAVYKLTKKNFASFIYLRYTEQGWGESREIKITHDVDVAEQAFTEIKNSFVNAVNKKTGMELYGYKFPILRAPIESPHPISSEEELRSELKKKPHPALYLELGKTLERNGRSDEAIEAYANSYNLNPNSIEPLYRSIRLQRKLESKDKSFRDKIGVLFPTLFPPTVTLDDTISKLEENLKTQSQMTEYRELLFFIGEAYLWANNKKKAHAAFKEWLGHKFRTSPEDVLSPETNRDIVSVVRALQTSKVYLVDELIPKEFELKDEGIVLKCFNYSERDKAKNEERNINFLAKNADKLVTAAGEKFYSPENAILLESSEPGERAFLRMPAHQGFNFAYLLMRKSLDYETKLAYHERAVDIAAVVQSMLTAEFKDTKTVAQQRKKMSFADGERVLDVYTARFFDKYVNPLNRLYQLIAKRDAIDSQMKCKLRDCLLRHNKKLEEAPDYLNLVFCDRGAQNHDINYSGQESSILVSDSVAAKNSTFRVVDLESDYKLAGMHDVANLVQHYLSNLKFRDRRDLYYRWLVNILNARTAAVEKRVNFADLIKKDKPAAGERYSAIGEYVSKIDPALTLKKYDLLTDMASFGRHADVAGYFIKKLITAYKAMSQLEKTQYVQKYALLDKANKEQANERLQQVEDLAKNPHKYPYSSSALGAFSTPLNEYYQLKGYVELNSAYRELCTAKNRNIRICRKSLERLNLPMPDRKLITDALDLGRTVYFNVKKELGLHS